MKNIKEYIFNNKIIKGDNLSPVEAATQYDKLENYHKDFESLFGVKDLEKTAEDNYVIDKYNEYLQAAIANLGLKFGPVPKDMIKLLNNTDYAKVATDQDSSGTFDPNLNLIIIKRFEGISGVRQYHNMMHEMIHGLSFQKLVINQDEERHSQRIWYDFEKNDSQEFAFGGFNEGVTELLTVEILNEHKVELLGHLEGFKKMFPDFREGFFKVKNGAYPAIASMLIKRLSQKSQQSEAEIWNKFKTGLLTGDMMPLRDIENCFGKDSLKVLAKCGQGGEIDSQVNDYFLSDDSAERDRIKKGLLST